MDKDLIKKRFSRAASTYSQKASIQQMVAGRMAWLIHRYVPRNYSHRTLEVGCGTGLFTRRLLKAVAPEQLVLNDICPDMARCFTDLPVNRVRFLSGDAERIVLPQGQGLIASCSALQWFNDPDAFFLRCYHALDDSGYLAFSTFGRENMQEITSLTGVGLPYRSLEELRSSLSATYDVLYTHEERFTLTFSSPLEVLRHLRETGVTGIRSQHWTRTDLTDFCNRYEACFSKLSTDGKAVTLTYHPIYIVAKKKSI